jgi:methylenetetrahydrofolate dehydrogenase (NADP+) / methenyltetrahydrofolate cyclohydrolase
MPALILEGKPILSKIIDELKSQTVVIEANSEPKPHLAFVCVGYDAASETYVKSKVKHCGLVGYISSMHRFEKNTTQIELLKYLDLLNKREDIHGLLVQLPLPDHIRSEVVIDHILPERDVDGFHPLNMGRMMQARNALLPATPAGIVELLRRYNIKTDGLHCVVVGRSNIVGTPISLLLSRNDKVGNCTVTLCHSHTKNLQQHTLQADLLIAAAGVSGLIKKEHVKPGAIVIDVGIHRIQDNTKKSGFRLIGDVVFDEVLPLVSAITPVPGGVGPMTIASLLQNTMKAFNKSI